MRKIIQISGFYPPAEEFISVQALCDDGTVWRTLRENDLLIWSQLPPIPQEDDKVKNKNTLSDYPIEEKEELKPEREECKFITKCKNPIFYQTHWEGLFELYCETHKSFECKALNEAPLKLELGKVFEGEEGRR